MENLPEYKPNTENFKEDLSKIRKKTFFLMAIVILFLVTLGLGLFYLIRYINIRSDNNKIVEVAQEKIEGMMILIEYKDTIGLVNFVNELHKRNIPGILHISADFIEKNCDTVNKLLEHDMEVMASIDGVLWDMPYDQQKTLISDAKERVEACTDKPVKIISSTYMASDLTTLKVADELNIPYVTARGTTDTKATVYLVEGYKAKILSVSNISNVKFKYGSLCDYSFFERSGKPEDMLRELIWAIQPSTEKEKATYGPYNKVTPVTHTNIGGYLEPWMNMWINFWDSTTDKIRWNRLDDFMAESDWVLPDWQVPINKNAPYTPEKIRPIISYDETNKVINPCKVEDLGTNQETDNSSGKQVDTQNKLVVFHNGQGSMCLEFLEFIKTINYPIEEHLVTDADFSSQLTSYKVDSQKSEGVSESFGYYPIIFLKDKAYSGFNEKIKQDILNQISK